jgi:hypothetical protein
MLKRIDKKKRNHQSLRLMIRTNNMNQLKTLVLTGMALFFCLAVLAACSTQNPEDAPVHVKLSECAKIADRSERTRCIDAANRTRTQ